MINLLADLSALNLNAKVILFSAGIFVLAIFLFSNLLIKAFYSLLNLFFSPASSKFAQELIEPYRKILKIVIILSIIELTAIFTPLGEKYQVIEIINSLGLTFFSAWLISRLSAISLDTYLINLAAHSGKKANSELIISAKVIFNLLIAIIAIFCFAQTHKINLFGLLASLGIGGLAIAFAAQKTLEQFLGSVVIYLDQPFTIDDYIGLSDGVFGRVESIGWRSTKIRTSGKGTVIIIPNNSLTQMNIENFSGAKKVMSILNLNFNRILESQEKALIRQVILASTKDIFGIDSRSTDISFSSINNENEEPKNQVQVTFFILGSGEVSMELRRQLLDIARENIDTRLKEYGIEFTIDKPTIYVDAPITI